MGRQTGRQANNYADEGGVLMHVAMLSLGSGDVRESMWPASSSI